MRKDRDFLLETKIHRKNIKRRKMKVHGVGILWQADLGFMFRQSGKIGFLLCIDIFSRRLFCEVIKDKTAKETRRALKKIFSETHIVPEMIETDQGSEFKGNGPFFNKKKIYLKFKIGRNKASFAEYGIHLVKTRLFRLCRTMKTLDWPRYLNQIVEAINNSPNSAIGGIRPSEIKTPLDGVKIDNAVGIPEDKSFTEQRTAQKEYERKKDKMLLQKGDYVFADFGPSVMAKGYDSPVCSFFKKLFLKMPQFPKIFRTTKYSA